MHIKKLVVVSALTICGGAAALLGMKAFSPQRVTGVSTPPVLVTVPRNDEIKEEKMVVPMADTASPRRIAELESELAQIRDENAAQQKLLRDLVQSSRAEKEQIAQELQTLKAVVKAESIAAPQSAHGTAVMIPEVVSP